MTTTLPEIEDMISEVEILAILEEIWGSLITGDEVLIPVRVDVPADGLSAWVLIVGPWSGSVVISAPRPMAEAFTREMLTMGPEEELTHEDLTDACGEVANVLGGNIKSLLHEGSLLGLPQTGPSTEAPGGRVVCRADVLWRGEPFSAPTADDYRKD
jgi:chemotaxis protein CheX